MKTLHTYTIIALLVLSLSCAGSAAYEVGQPAVLDTTVVKQATGRLQTNPAVAGEADSFMAVWVDMRDSGNIADLFAARLGPTGAVLDPGNIRLTEHACVLGRPDIACNGSEYFVVYANADGVMGSRINGIRLSADGEVLSESPILIPSYHNARDPRVSWDGSRWVVVWSGDSPTDYCGIFVARVGPTGTVLDATPITVSAGSPVWNGIACSNPAVASAPGARSLIVWTRNSSGTGVSNDLYAAAFVAELGIVNAFAFPIYSGTTSQDTPDTCWAGDHFKVVWADGEPVGRLIAGMRVDGCGVPMDIDPWIVSDTADRQYDPQIAWNGANCVATWTRRVAGGTDIYAGRLDAAGAPLDGDGFAVCSADGRQAKSAAALMTDPSTDDSLLVCWTDDRDGAAKTLAGFGTQIVEAVVNAAGDTPTVGAETRLAESASPHKALCSAWNGQKFLVCWEEWTESGRTLKGALADPNTGQPTASAPFEIMPIPATGIGPRAIWNGENFVLMWVEGYDFKALRISPSGAVLDPTPITVLTGSGSPAGWSLATDGDKCLVAYRTGKYYRAAIVRRDCTVATDTLVYTSTTGYGNIAACWAGQYYVLAWRHLTTTNAIGYTTINQAGALSGIRQITDTSSPSEFHLASNDQSLLLISRGTEVHSYGGWDFIVKKFPNSPVPLVVTTDAAGQENVRFFWDGFDYVLTWTIANPDPLCGAAVQSDLQFTRISSGNQLVGASGVNVLSSANSELGGTMCAGPIGRTLAAFAAYEDAPYQSARVQGVYLDTLMNVSSLTALGQLYEGAYVSLPGQLVSASFPGDRFYVQYYRTFGIGVKTAQAVDPGAMVTFTGRLKKIDGETVVDASEVDVLTTGSPTPEPLGIRVLDLGGIAPTSGYTTVSGGRGLYNVGLLVNTFGRVTAVGDGYFYLDDGSNVPAESGHVGVKVYGTLPATAVQYVAVIGVSGAELDGSEILRVIRSIEVQAISAP